MLKLRTKSFATTKRVTDIISTWYDKWIEFNFPIELSKSHSLWNVCMHFWFEELFTCLASGEWWQSPWRYELQRRLTYDKIMIYFPVTSSWPAHFFLSQFLSKDRKINESCLNWWLFAISRDLRLKALPWPAASFNSFAMTKIEELDWLRIVTINGS